MDLIYCCYRNGFPSVSGFTDDVGWGCTIRSFQMLIANTMVRSESTKSQDASRFVEDTVTAPFSLQSIVVHGSKYGIEAGQWFSPSIAAKTVKDIWEKQKNPLPFSFKVYGENLKRDDVLDKPALVVLPVKLGIDVMEKYYADLVLNLLEYDLSVGIVGGKGNSSFYFIGTDDGKVLYLDPHVLRDHGNKDFSVPKIHKTNVDDLNPSMALAFYVRDTEEFRNLVKRYEVVFSTADVVDDGKKYKLVDNDDYCVILEDDEDEDLI